MLNEFSDEEFISKLDPHQEDIDAFWKYVNEQNVALRPAIKVLMECGGLHIRKSGDYQNQNSSVR